MAYNNRLTMSCKPCQGKQEETQITTPLYPKDEPKKETTGLGSIGGSHCDLRKITAITMVGDKVHIMFDDCTYMTACKSVVSKELFSTENDNTLGSRVENLEKEIKEITESLVDIQDTDGDVTHKAFLPTYKQSK